MTTIYPYLSSGKTWVFDDARTGLKAEAFVAGCSEAITLLAQAKSIPAAERGFALSFSDRPFDGHDAWKIIPRMRKSIRRPRAAKRAPAPAPEPEPEPVRTPEEQRALDESSQRTAAELIARLSRKSDAPTQDR